MPVRIEFQFLGEKQIDRRLERFTVGLRDFSPVFQQMHKDFLRIEKSQFRSEGRRAGSHDFGWAPLNWQYVNKKQSMINRRVLINGRSAKDPKILHLTDRLRDSLISEHNGDHMVKIDRQEAEFGTHVHYASVHQNSKRIPQRKPIDLTENDKRKWVRLLQNHLRTSITGAAVE